ncbi:MAG: type II CAAX endopeptidase family protein [Chlamydiota bacterium]
MTLATFTHILFWKEPLSTLCFFSLGMSFVSLWVKKTPWLWGSFLFISYILAFQTNTVNWLSAIPLFTLLICHYSIHCDIHKGARFLLVGIATAVSYALIFHLLPGFHNWKIASEETISASFAPVSLWLSYDKPWIGIFILGLSLPLISSRVQLIRMLKLAIPLSLIGILLLMLLSLYLGALQWDPKIPIFIFVWLLNNLILVVIPEEAFFRGFLQREVNMWFGGTAFSGCCSVVASSLFFTLAHLGWVADLPLLATTITAGIIYGTIYHTTKSIEASILCHFGVNLTRLLFFT